MDLKKLAFYSLGTIFALLLLAGCGSSQPASNDSVVTGREDVTVTVPPDSDAQLANRDSAAGSSRVQGIPTPGPTDIYDPDRDGFMEAPEMVQSVEDIWQNFYFPPGYQFAIEQFRVEWQPSVEENNELFQIRYNYTVIVMAQTCAWMQYWIDSDQSGDSEGREEAVLMLTEVFPNAFTFSSMRDSLTDWGNAAALGDTSTIQQAMTTLGCDIRYYRPDWSGPQSHKPSDYLSPTITTPIHRRV